MSEINKQTIEEVLRERGKYIGPTVGTSMLPMLKHRRDTIVVEAKTQRLKPLDVALYKRGTAYILHRVLEVRENDYIIRGDNCYYDEIVPEECVIGVLTEFFRNKKHYHCTDKRYLKYVNKRVKNYPRRRFFQNLREKTITALKKTVKRILHLEKRRK